MNWVLQLINSQKSRGEVQHATFSQATQPIPKPICDRSGQLEDTQSVFVVERSMRKDFTKNSVLQMDQGNLIICLKTSELSKFTKDQGLKFPLSELRS